MYGIAVITLIEVFDDCVTVQMLYADYDNAIGSLDDWEMFFNSLKNLSLFWLPSHRVSVLSLAKNILSKKHNRSLFTTNEK